MSETNKTLAFVAVALVLGVAAAIPQFLGKEEVKLDEKVNQLLFPDFTNPEEAKSLEIVKVDEELAELKSFKVAQVNNLWVIPSHGNYPADAANKMHDVASSLFDLKILEARTLDAEQSKGSGSEEEADKKPDTFAKYDLVEPDPEQIAAGDKGIGTMITIEDFKGNDLLKLIVGKEVKGNPELRFVRLPGQEVIYVTKIDLSNLSTKFEDWIEKDLLHVAGIDIADITIKDYSARFDQSGELQYDPHYNIHLKADGGWELTKLEAFDLKGQPFETSLQESEELDTSKLASLKTALDNLEIVDVQEKPRELAAQLQATVLVTKGFFPMRSQATGGVEVFSSNGAINMTTKDGVEYLLNFGAAEQSSDDDDEEETLQRNLMVSARVNESQFPEPEYEELPPLPAEPEAADAEAAPDESDDGEKKIDPVKVERERIQRENDRKREEWEEKRKKAADKVRELNSRFDNYYYLVSEETFQEINLSLADIVKQKDDAIDTGFEIDSFRKLEDDGLPEQPADSVE